MCAQFGIGAPSILYAVGIMMVPSNSRRSVEGWIGVMLLIAAWASVVLTPMSAGSRWAFRIFMVAAIMALGSFVLSIFATRRSSKMWYLLAGAALLSQLILLADLFAGD